jgi:hypothetical protein
LSPQICILSIAAWLKSETKLFLANWQCFEKYCARFCLIMSIIVSASMIMSLSMEFPRRREERKDALKLFQVVLI